MLPLVVGRCATAEAVAAVLDALWGGPETIIVVSTDLSHYHRYADAVALDRRTAAAIAAAATRGDRRPRRLRRLPAARPAAPRRAAESLRADVLDLRNSGDTAGDRETGGGLWRLRHRLTGHPG